MENVIKDIEIKVVTTERRRNYLVSKANYHTKNFFIGHPIAIEMKKEFLIKKRRYLT